MVILKTNTPVIYWIEYDDGGVVTKTGIIILLFLG